MNIMYKEIETSADIKTNEDWWNYYFTITSSGMVRVSLTKISRDLVPFPEKKLTIPIAMPYINESGTEKSKRIYNEKEKITNKINRQLTKGKITEEEAKEMMEEEFAKIPEVPMLPVKGIASNSRSFYYISSYLKRIFEREMRIDKTWDANLDLIERIREKMIEKIEYFVSIGKITEEEAEEYIKTIPSINDVIDNMERKLLDCWNRNLFDDPGIDKEKIKKILSDLREEPGLIDGIEPYTSECVEQVRQLMEKWDINVNSLIRIANARPSKYQFQSEDWYKNVFYELYLFSELDFEGVKDGKCPFTTFPKNSFYGFKIKKITVPPRLRKIGQKAFCEQGFEEFCVPRYKYNKITDSTKFSLDASSFMAFARNPNLKVLQLGNNITEYPSYMCDDCVSLEEFDYSASLECILNSAFQDCKNFNNKNFPKTLETIASDAFSYCGFTGEMILPPSLWNISPRAFSTNKIEKLTVSSECLTRDAFLNNYKLNHIEFLNGIEVAVLDAFRIEKNAAIPTPDPIKTLILPASIKRIAIFPDTEYYGPFTQRFNGTKIVFNGTVEQLLDATIIGLRPNYNVSDFNTKEDLMAGKIKFCEDDEPHVIEITGEKILTEKINEIYSKYENKEINEYDLSVELCDFAKNYNCKNFVSDFIVEKFSDLNGANELIIGGKIIDNIEYMTENEGESYYTPSEMTLER